MALSSSGTVQNTKTQNISDSYAFQDATKVRFTTTENGMLIDVFDSADTYFRAAFSNSAKKISFQRNNGTDLTTLFEK